MKISVVLPVYNEQSILHEVLAKYIKDLKTIGEEYELIAVNDGCDDGSVEILLAAGRLNRNLKIINFDARYGKQAAITAGMEVAKGDVVILADVDILNPVGILKFIIDEYKKGNTGEGARTDIVHAKREAFGADKFRMKISDRLVRLGTKLFGVNGNYAGKVNIALYSRAVADVIVALPDKNKFLRTMGNWTGWQVRTCTYASGYNKAEERVKIQESENKLRRQGQEPAPRDKTRDHSSSVIYGRVCLLLAGLMLVTAIAFVLIANFTTVKLPFFAHLMAWMFFGLFALVAVCFVLRAVLIKRIGVIHSKYTEKIYVIKNVVNA